MGAMERTAVDVVVTGRVQGVFFRAGLREQAERRGVTGWARNEPDGSVRAHLEGSPEAVDAVLDWCAEGSSRARVDDVATRSGTDTGARTFETG